MQKHTQLLCHEREKIYRGLCSGLSRRQIARELERSASTIVREIRRNSDEYGYFYPNDAHTAAKKRKHKNKPKIDSDESLRNYIIKKLKDRWSPAMITMKWNSKYKNKKISKETIYTWIYSKEGRKLELHKHLTRTRKKRGTKRAQKQPKIKNRVSIHERPAPINSRSEVGHYECDLMFNQGSQSQNICTLIDRVTRHAIMIRNENKSSSTVIDALIRHITENKVSIKSITFDNGSEFANHAKLHQLGIKTYFCDPGSPWQKGAIEHLNGMIRRFIPFKLSFHAVTKKLVAEVNKFINSMPRKILQNRTPMEVIRELAC